MDLEDRELRAGHEPHARGVATLHPDPPVDVQGGPPNSIEAALEPFSEPREGDQSAIERNRKLSTVRVARTVEICAHARDCLDLIGVVVKEDRGGTGRDCAQRLRDGARCADRRSSDPDVTWERGPGDTHGASL